MTMRKPMAFIRSKSVGRGASKVAARPPQDRRGNALLMQTQFFASRVRKRAREKTLGFFA